MKANFLIIGIILLVGCSKQDEIPSNILSEEQMVSVMIDLYLAESKISAENLKRDSSQALFDYYKEKLLEKHNIQDSTYQKSRAYYLERTKKLDAIYETVLDTLNLRKQKLEPKKENKPE